MQTEFRNICIIAHVDHGKTTLVDHILKQGGTFDRETSDICIMDSGELERERGITILAKNTSVRLGDVKVNIVDTPGHADFGAEVERIMSMVDGAILLVDAAEGPLPQTRFVLEKAIQQGLKIVLMINKVDRPEVQDSGRIDEVVNQAFDLFLDLGASEEQADFPILYACGRDGWCTDDKEKIPELLSGGGDLSPLFKLMIQYMPAPKLGKHDAFQMLIANLQYSGFVGQMAVGRIMSGKVIRNERITRQGVDHNGEPKQEHFNVSKLFRIEGLKQVDAEELVAGDIGLVAGCERFEIGDTLTNQPELAPIERIAVEEPTLGMMFSINTSPFSGKDGDAMQSRKMRERLLKEVRHNVAMRFEETESADQFRMLGRGELQFAVLIEQMRREGSEFMVGRPRVLFRTNDQGVEEEPIERAVADIPEAYAGEITELFQLRKGIMSKYENLEGSSSLQGGTRVKLEFEIPTRGLLGIRSRFMTLTRGEGLLSSEVIGYEPLRPGIPGRTNGSLIADRSGEAIEYALLSLEERGILFVEPGTAVYEGMIIGEHSRPNDLDVNPCKEKKLTNIRSATKEAFVTLKGIRKMSLEQFIEWIDDDEWIEVTPKNVRVRKKVLEKNYRQSQRNKHAKV